MNITLKQPLLIGARSYAKGDTVSVPDKRGRRLIERGFATESETPAEPTVEELKAQVATLDDPVKLQELRQAEEQGHKRDAVLEAIDARIAEVVSEQAGSKPMEKRKK